MATKQEKEMEKFSRLEYFHIADDCTYNALEHPVRINGASIYQGNCDLNVRPQLIACEGSGRLLIWNLIPSESLKLNDNNSMGGSDRREIFTGEKAILSIGLYDPYLFGKERNISSPRSCGTVGYDKTKVNISKPIVIVTGVSTKIQLWYFLER
jgi:hypothetical protein